MTRHKRLRYLDAAHRPPGGAHFPVFVNINCIVSSSRASAPTRPRHPPITRACGSSLGLGRTHHNSTTRILPSPQQLFLTHSSIQNLVSFFSYVNRQAKEHVLSLRFLEFKTWKSCIYKNRYPPLVLMLPFFRAFTVTPKVPNPPSPQLKSINLSLRRRALLIFPLPFHQS